MTNQETLNHSLTIKEGESIDPKAVRAEIISSVLTKGLVPSTQLAQEEFPYLPSVHSYPLKNTVGIILSPLKISNKDKGIKEIQRTLYSDWCSIFPIIMERKNERWPQTARLPSQTLEDRAQNSFLVVVKRENIEIYNAVFRENKNVWLSENFIVNPDDFLFLIVPQSLHHEQDEIFSSSAIQTIVVEQETARVFQRNLYGPLSKPRPLLVPDYEQVLHNLLSQTDQDLFIHAVRLSTDTENIESIQNY